MSSGDAPGTPSRAATRRGWPVRLVAPGAEFRDDPDERTTPEQRLAMVWTLTLEAWALSGRPIPAYSRGASPVRLCQLDRRNTERVWAALERFGAPIDTLGATAGDLARPGLVLQIGLPPRRIDILTELTGVDFESAWRSRVSHRVGSLEIPFLDRETLIWNKRATGRLRDLADVERLEEEPG